MRMIFTLLLFSIFLLSCDENNNMISEPMPSPTPMPECICLSESPDFLSGFEDCTTDGLAEICNPYLCIFTDNPDPLNPELLSGHIQFSDCQVIDCLNTRCNFTKQNKKHLHTSILTINRIDNNSCFLGTSEIDGIIGEYLFDCGPVVP